jgi:hypothetical protein
LYAENVRLHRELQHEKERSTNLEKKLSLLEGTKTKKFVISYNYKLFSVSSDIITEGKQFLAGLSKEGGDKQNDKTIEGESSPTNNPESADDESDREDEDDGNECKPVRLIVYFSCFNFLTHFTLRKGAFPIKKDWVDTLKKEPKKQFILDLVGGLYSRQFLIKHKMTSGKATIGTDNKKAINPEQLKQIIGEHVVIPASRHLKFFPGFY